VKTSRTNFKMKDLKRKKYNRLLYHQFLKPNKVLQLVNIALK
jgi:hypothetical protein